MTSVTKSFKNSTAAPASEKHPRKKKNLFAINFVQRFALQFQFVPNRNERSNLRTHRTKANSGVGGSKYTKTKIVMSRGDCYFINVSWVVLFISGDLYPLSFSYGSLWFVQKVSLLNSAPLHQWLGDLLSAMLSSIFPMIKSRKGSLGISVLTSKLQNNAAFYVS